jgi:hypothetical protein
MAGRPAPARRPVELIRGSVWDDRPRLLTPDDLADHPIFSALPAVTAGGLVAYPFYAPLSYRFMAQQYRTIAEAVRSADAGLV